MEDPNPLYHNTYYTFEFNGDFGNTGRKFFVSATADSQYGKFEDALSLMSFAITSKSNPAIMPWTLPGMFTQQDVVEYTGELIKSISGFQKYQPQK